MPVEIKMPALSPTMEEGTLAKWLVKEGDKVSSGDLLAEIETDKATMEFESIDEGTVTSILVAAGTENVKVGQVIAIIAAEGEAASPGPVAKAAATPAPTPVATSQPKPVRPEPVEGPSSTIAAAATPAQPVTSGDRIAISPLAKRLAEQNGIDISTLKGTGPNGRLVKADIEAAIAGGTPAKAAASAPADPTSAHPEPVEGAGAAAPRAKPEPVAAQSNAATAIPDFGIPHEDTKLSTMRKVIARRLAQSMQEAPHIYLSVDVRLDALLKLRGELNASLASRNLKLSVNDMLIKALAVALEQVPQCNVSFGGDTLRQYHRADISVAVSIPGGLITPIITNAGAKSISAIASEMADLAARAKTGKLQPAEFQGGTASISNMGMMGIKQFTAVINPPQAMILAVGAGEKRPYVVDDALAVATVMTCTGSFDHRAIDGADGAQLMAVFKTLVENPLGLVA